MLYILCSDSYVGHLKVKAGTQYLHSPPLFIVELGLVIGKGGADIRQEDALSHVGGMCVWRYAIERATEGPRGHGLKNTLPLQVIA